MAAVLAGGEGAVLSHRSAAALWEISKEQPRHIDVSVRRRCELHRPGILFRGRLTLPPRDLLVRDDIPVTSPIQTLLDLATELEPLALERAVNNADKRDLIDPETLREKLDRYSNQKKECAHSGACSTSSSSGSPTRTWRSTSAES